MVYILYVVDLVPQLVIINPINKQTKTQNNKFLSFNISSPIIRLIVTEYLYIIYYLNFVLYHK
jgi:hypothetical protein